MLFSNSAWFALFSLVQFEIKFLRLQTENASARKKNWKTFSKLFYRHIQSMSDQTVSYKST